jgi:hypothetical protein
MSEEMKDQLTTADLAYGKPETTEERTETDNRLDAGHVTADKPEAVAISGPSLLPDEGRSEYQERWGSIQTKFVDEPKQCVQEADALVADVIQQLATKFAEQRKSLEQQWGSGGEASTEDLRQAFNTIVPFSSACSRPDTGLNLPQEPCRRSERLCGITSKA